MSTWVRTAAVVAAVAVGGCASLMPDMDSETFIGDQWSTAMRKFNFYPVYPPSEDVEVGDIYAVGRPCDSNRKPLSVKIDHMPLKRALIARYRDRIGFPSTANEKKDKEIYPEQPKAEGGATIYDPNHVGSVPIEALPGFTIAKVRYGQAAGGGSFPLFGLFAGFRGQEDLKIALSVPRGETYGLPAYDAIEAMRRYCSGAAGYYPAPCERRKLEDAVSSVRFGEGVKLCGAYPMIVFRVFTTRQIDYTYLYEGSRAASISFMSTLGRAIELNGAAAKIAAVGAPGVVKGVPEEETPPDGSPGTGSGEVSPVEAAIDERDKVLIALMQQVNEDLTKMAAAGAPGAVFGFGAYDGAGIHLKQTFERPIAIGYAALRWDPERGEPYRGRD